MSRDKIGFYQFTHPGKEHGVKHKIAKTNLYFKEWNYRFSKSTKGYKTNNHCRKYMRASANYIENGVLRSGLVDFWGEWEPNSIAVALDKKAPAFLPKYLHYPIFISNDTHITSENNIGSCIEKLKNIDIANSNVPEIHTNTHPSEKKIYDSKNNNNLQNTDPYVFGDNFYYTCCKQPETKHLKEGSVILFGTGYRSKKIYEIDTVFVISEIIHYNKETLSKTLSRFQNSENPSEKMYYDVVLNQVFRRHDGSIAYFDDYNFQYDIIVGATYENPYNGMYSYFLCNPSTSQGKLKLRIGDNIDVLNALNSYADQPFGLELSTHGKNIVLDDQERVYKMWELIKNYAMHEGYSLGVKAETPPTLTVNEIQEYISNIM